MVGAAMRADDGTDHASSTVCRWDLMCAYRCRCTPTSPLREVPEVNVKHSCQLDGFFGALTYSAAPTGAVYEADNLEAFRLRPEMHGSCIVVQDPCAGALLLSAMF